MGLVKNQPVKQKTRLWFLGWEDPWRRNRLTTLIFLGFPHGSDGEESACNVRDLGSIPGLGRPPGERNSNPLQYSCLENSMEGRAWWATIHESCSTKGQIWLSDFTFTFIMPSQPIIISLISLASWNPIPLSNSTISTFFSIIHSVEVQILSSFFFFYLLAQIVKTNTFSFGMTGHAKN